MNLKYRPDIDGLRAIAVISIIIFHLNNNWLSGGFVGVDIFFVISGFLITKKIYTDILNQQFNFKNFYQKRINRILPVFFVVMFCTSFIAWFLLLPDAFMLFLKSLKSTTYFWENMFFAKNTGGYWDVSAEQMPILHTWSLAVEEQFYILLPFLLLFLFKLKFQTKKNYLIVILLIIAIISFSFAQISPNFAFLTKYNYYSLFTARAGELLIGSIIGILSIKFDHINNKDNKNLNYLKKHLIINNILTLIGFLLLCGSIILLSGKNLFPSFWAMFPVIGAALIIFYYDKNTFISKFLSIKPLVFIGTISYSLYLWHWPIIVLTRQYLLVDKFENITQYVTIVVIIMILSLASYFFIESPCRKNKKTFKFSFIFYYLIPVMIIFSVYEVQKQTKFLNFRYEKKLEVYNLMKKRVWESGEFGTKDGYINNTFGDINKKPEILFIGDSFAEAYLPYLDLAGKKYHFSFKVLISHMCPLLPHIDKKYKEFSPHPHKTRCVNLIPSELKENIKRYKVIIYTSNFKDYLNSNIYSNHMNFYENVNELAKDIKNLGSKFIIFDRVRSVEHNVLNQYYNAYLKNTLINISFDKDDKDINNLMKRKIGSNAIFFNPMTGLSKQEKSELPLYHGLIITADGAHLNSFVTKQWSEEVLPKQKVFWENLIKSINN